MKIVFSKEKLRDTLVASINKKYPKYIAKTSGWNASIAEAIANRCVNLTVKKEFWGKHIIFEIWDDGEIRVDLRLESSIDEFKDVIDLVEEVSGKEVLINIVQT